MKNKYFRTFIIFIFKMYEWLEENAYLKKYSIEQQKMGFNASLMLVCIFV